MRLPKITVALLLCMSVIACSNKRLDRLERRMSTDVEDLRTTQANHTAHFDEIRQELRELRGSIEELNYASQGKVKEFEKTLQKLGRRVPPPPGVPENLLTADEDRIRPIPGADAEVYRDALAALRTGEFTASKSLFQTFIDGNPGTSFTDNALFWKGIASSKLSLRQEAVLSFSEVFQTYPAEDMAAPALYFLSGVLLQSGDTEDAILTLEKLLEDYPSSSFGEQAQARLSSLNGSAKKKKKRRR